MRGARWGFGLLSLMATAHGGSAPVDAESRRQLQEGARQIRALQAAPQARPDAVSVPALPPVSGDTRCLPLQAVRVTGVTLLDAADRAALPALPSGCLSAAALDAFIRALTARYVEHGYIAARVLPEAADDGLLTLRVVEGQVEAIRLEGGGDVPFTLFPGVIGHPLNLRDIEQGLDQANRLPSSEARIRIEPGDTAGGSVLYMSAPSGASLHGMLALDNTGSEATGRWLETVSASLDSPLGWADALGLTLQQTAGRDTEKASRSASLSYSLPYGYWTLGFGYAQSQSRHALHVAGFEIPVSGETAQGNVRLERVTGRDAGGVRAVYLQLSHKRVRNAVFDSVQSISSPTLTEATTGFNVMQLLPAGSATLDLSLTRGLPWFGADKDAVRESDDLPRAQFTRLNLSAGLTLVSGAWQWQSVWTGQASRDPLPGVEQLELADAGSVRGYRQNSLAGETGWVWRNTVYRLFPFEGMTLAVRAGVDAGRVFPRDGYTPWRTLEGISWGMALTGRRASLDIEYSRPLRHPDRMNAEPDEILLRGRWQW